MNLSISETIRAKRRELCYSQEQLADMLGVSSQSVSRWETASTYPDIELLPLIANVFGITTDELLGVPLINAENKKAAYRREADAFPRGSRERISVLRRACTEFSFDWELTYSLCRELIESGADGYPEACSTAYKALEKCRGGKWRYDFTSLIAQTESDERVFDFLDRHTSDIDSRRDNLLAWRYLTRENYDLYLAMTQKHRIFALNSILNGPVIDAETLADNEKPITPDHERRIRVLSANLAYVNSVIGIDDEVSRCHPIIGDGVPDMWFITRYKNGFTLMSRLAAVGLIDEALNMCNELATLIINFFTLDEGKILSYRFDKEGRLDAAISYIDDESGRSAKLTFVHRVGFRPDGESETMPIYRASELIAPFLNKSNPFKSEIWNHPRFSASVERMRNATGVK